MDKYKYVYKFNNINDISKIEYDANDITYEEVKDGRGTIRLPNQIISYDFDSIRKDHSKDENVYVVIGKDNSIQFSFDMSIYYIVKKNYFKFYTSTLKKIFMYMFSLCFKGEDTLCNIHQ